MILLNFKKNYILISILLIACKGFSQNTNASNVIAVGCQEASTKTCTKKKAHEAISKILSTTQKELLFNNTDSDLIFARILFSYNYKGELETLASYIHFYEDETTPLGLDLYGGINQLDFKIKKPSKESTHATLKEVVYFKINRSKKTLEPLYDYIPDVIPFSKPDSYIIFPGCENTGSYYDQMGCFTEKMMQHIRKHFNSDLITDLDLEGIVKIKIFFSVEKDGSIKNLRIKAPHPQMIKSMERVFKLLPNLKPAIIDGMPKSVPILIPFNFIVD